MDVAAQQQPPKPVGQRPPAVMPKRGTKTKNAKLKIAAHHNAKGRGGTKKSAKVRKREAELDILADEREAEIKLEAAAKRQER